MHAAAYCGREKSRIRLLNVLYANNMFKYGNSDKTSLNSMVTHLQTQIKAFYLLYSKLPNSSTYSIKHIDIYCFLNAFEIREFNHAKTH